MSSILEALKKAERDSTAERGADTPWPAPRMPKRLPCPPPKRRWWLSLGIAGIVCVSAGLFWQLRHHELPWPAPSNVSSPVPQAPSSSPPLAAREAPAKLPLDPKELTRPARRPVDTAPQQTQADRPVPLTQARTPEATVLPIHPATLPVEKPSREALTPVTSKIQPPPLPEPQEPFPPAELSGVSAVDSRRFPKGAAVPLSPPPPEDQVKTYRSDPRIELQALVWAPEAAARFVVINNHLIKEGGATGGITVVRIDRDDVLLSEGSDQWHEKFKIR